MQTTTDGHASRDLPSRRNAGGGRFFQDGGHAGNDSQAWFYRMREGTFGPFASRDLARADFRRRLIATTRTGWFSRLLGRLVHRR